MSAYTHFQYIAYQVPTVGWNGGAYIPRIPTVAINAPNPDLKGNTAGLSPDAQNRIRRFIRVLNMAHSRIQGFGGYGGDKYTLKIFMAPEFYFRPDNANQAYSEDEYAAIKDVLCKTIGDDNRFINWLVIPGTIMWRKQHPPGSGIYVYLNTSLYIKVGNWTKTSGEIEKTQASPIDGLGGNALNIVQTSHQTLDSRKKHVFEHWGTYCGLEVCLEHAVQNGTGLLKVLLNSWEIRGWTTNYQRPISLQLLTAGGMGINPHNVATRTNGYILRSDGLYNHPYPLQSNLCRITQYTNNHIASTYNNIPSVATLNPNPYAVTNVVDDNAIVDALHSYGINAGNDLYLPPPGGCLPGYWFQQRIKVYDRMAL